MNPRVSSYSRDVRIPSPGGYWIWELNLPSARALIEIVEVKWNGEEWWVKTRTVVCDGIMLALRPDSSGEHWNDLSRFFEASTPVGGGYISMTRKVSAPKTGEKVIH